MFRKTYLVAVLMVFTVLLPGCVVVGAGVGYSLSESAADDLAGVVEVGDIKIKKGVDIATVRNAMNTAKVSPGVFNEDMSTLNTSPDQDDIRVNVAVVEEAKRFINLPSTSTATTVRLKTFYYQGFLSGGFYYYGRTTERDALSYWQKNGVRKAINVHLTIENGNDVFLEVHGLWVGNSKADEIAGARQLARGVASEVIKKLTASPASLPASVAEAEANKK
jgi:hypothetical protein